MHVDIGDLIERARENGSLLSYKVVQAVINKETDLNTVALNN